MQTSICWGCPCFPEQTNRDAFRSEVWNTDSEIPTSDLQWKAALKLVRESVNVSHLSVWTHRVMFFQECLSIFHMGNTRTEALFLTHGSFFLQRELHGWTYKRIQGCFTLKPIKIVLHEQGRTINHSHKRVFEIQTVPLILLSEIL